MTHRVGVVADDVTGATDTAVQFADVGWPTIVALAQPLDPRPAYTAGAVAVTTDARAASGPVAKARTAQAVHAMAAMGVEHLYLKIDSTMRGSVAAQLAGAVEAWSEKHPGSFALLCPAYPAMGRTVTAGEARMNGDPLQAGAPGLDPVTPVRTSVLSDLVPGAVRAESADRSPAELARSIHSAAGHASVVTVDAVTQADLGKIAEAATLIGPQVVPAGSAGLASALAVQWREAQDRHRPAPKQPARPRSAPTLVLVSSLNRTARAQQKRLTEELRGRVETIEPELGDLLDDQRFAIWRNEQAHRSFANHEVVLVSAPVEKSISAQDAADQIAQRLADLAADLHAKLDFAAVVVTGGDGARALVDRWDCTGIAIHSALIEGMPQGVLVGGEVDGLPVVTKAGGFGDGDALVVAVRSSHADPPAGDRTR